MILSNNDGNKYLLYIIPSLCRCSKAAQLIKLGIAKRLSSSCLQSKLNCTIVQQHLFTMMGRKHQISSATIQNKNNLWTLLDRINFSTTLQGKKPFLSMHIYAYIQYICNMSNTGCRYTFGQPVLWFVDGSVCLKDQSLVFLAALQQRFQSFQ